MSATNALGITPLGGKIVWPFQLLSKEGGAPKKRHSALLVTHLEQPNCTPLSLIRAFWKQQSQFN